MELTPFQKKWTRDAKKWGLKIEAPFVVEVEGAEISVPVLLREFGAVCGMLLVTNFDQVSEYAKQLVNLGYGFSCLSEKNESPHPDDDEAMMEILTDWGWSGLRCPPSWYRGEIS